MKMTLRTEHTLVDEQGRPVEPGARVRNLETGLIGTIGGAEESPEGWDVYFHINMGSDRPYDLKAAEVVRSFSLLESEAEPRPGGWSRHVAEGLQRPSVVDRGSREIEARWAKETIGLVAVELNEAYAEFDNTRDSGDIPSGKLYRAAERLAEAMKRLGITGDEIPF